MYANYVIKENALFVFSNFYKKMAFHFLSPPAKNDWNLNPQIFFRSLWKMKSEEFIFCWHVPLENLSENFVGFFKEKSNSPCPTQNTPS